MEIPVTLNVKSANVIPVINCMQGDTPTIICTIMNGDDTFIADPGEFDLCVCEGETAKHKAISIKCAVNSNIVTVHLTKNETDEAGDLKLCISFSNTAQELVVSTFPFILKATENPAYSAVGQKENIKALTDYIAEAKKYADAAKNLETNVAESVENVKKYAESASESVINAEKSKKLSQSYAIGDSGVREGEEKDNSKYYSEKSAESKQAADKAAELAGQKAEEARQLGLEASENAKSASESVINAEKAEKLSQSYALGDSGIREGEKKDNSKYYSEKSAESKQAADKAAELAGQKAEEAKQSGLEASENAKSASESVTNAEKAQKLSQSYAIGNSGLRENEDTDNSKWYAQQAEKYAKQAEDIAGGNFIPESEKGIAGGVAVLDANLAVAKAVADEDGNNIKKSLKGKSDSNHTHLYAGSNTAGGIANSSNLVYATSHQGEWYQNSQWDGTYFQTNYKHGDDVLPMRVGYSGYSDNSGKVNNHTVSSDVPANAKFTDTTYSDATTSAHGLMSTSDKSKLNGIAAGANKTTILNSLAATTTGYALDAIQGKALNDKITAINDSLAHMAWQNVGSNLFVETDTTYVSYNTLQAYILTGCRLVDFAIVFTTKQALTKGTDYYFCKLTYTPDDVPYNYLVYYDNNAAVLTVKTNGNVFLRPLTADIPVNYTLNARGIFKN